MKSSHVNPRGLTPRFFSLCIRLIESSNSQKNATQNGEGNHHEKPSAKVMRKFFLMIGSIVLCATVAILVARHLQERNILRLRSLFGGDHPRIREVVFDGYSFEGRKMEVHLVDQDSVRYISEKLSKVLYSDYVGGVRFHAIFKMEGGVEARCAVDVRRDCKGFSMYVPALGDESAGDDVV